MRSLWVIASILCLIAAAFFLLRENYDGAFALAALGAVAWFLDYRAKIRRSIEETAETTPDETDASEDDDEEDH
jgi:hypothetical protein